MSNRVKNFLLTDNLEDILFYAEYNSSSLFQHIKENLIDHELILCRKYLTHSDILTKGKPTKKSKALLSNEDFAKSFILYYQSTRTLLDNYEKLPTAAQSNIGIPEDFIKILGINSYKENNKKKYDICSKYNFDILIPLDSCKDFNMQKFLQITNYNNKNKYTQSDLKKLGAFKLSSHLDQNNPSFVKCDTLHFAAHGFGIDKDKVFAYIRSFAFKGDVVNFIFDKTDKKLYVYFERNEEYYNLLNEINGTPITKPIWKDYTPKDKKEIVETLYAIDVNNAIENGEIQELTTDAISERKISELLKRYYDEYNKTIDDIVALDKVPKTRWYQKKWKEVLIKMDELALNEKGYAICAISGIKGLYAKLGKFFIASHIKPYALCIEQKDYESAFDPNNGLILVANLDALFDQYLISINADDGVILKNDIVLSITKQQRILFNNKNEISKYYLTEKRKDYLRLHNEIFQRKVQINE